MSTRLKFINEDEIFTNILDAVMPDRNKDDGPTEISNRLKMTNLVCLSLLNKYITAAKTAITIKERNYKTEKEVDKCKAGLVAYNGEDSVLFVLNDDRKHPATIAEIILVNMNIEENEELIKEEFGLDTLIKSDEYGEERTWSFNIYNSSKWLKEDVETNTKAEDAIVTTSKFIEANNLKDKYGLIGGLYFLGLLSYVDDILKSDKDYTEFKRVNKVRPDYCITPVIEGDYTKFIVFNRF